MKARPTTELLDRLEDRLRKNRTLAEQLNLLPDADLQRRPAPGAWSALEAVEHLNIWSGDYLDRVEAALHDHGTRPKDSFTSSWIGNFFAASVKPGPKTRKLPTLKKLNPIHRDLTRDGLHTWLANCDRLEALLRQSRSADLKRVRIKTVLSSLIHMRLGDILRMMVYHDWRHLEQAARASGGGPVR